MSQEFPQEARNSEPRRFGCAHAVLLLLVGGGIVVGTLLYVAYQAFTGFEFHREKICLRRDLVVVNENLWYSPGMDAIMWCRFTAEATSIDEVFDKTRVNPEDLTTVGYDIRHSTPISNRWWDAEQQYLTGGDVVVEPDKSFMRVGYVDNGDGTLTVYIFWYEV